MYSSQDHSPYTKLERESLSIIIRYIKLELPDVSFKALKLGLGCVGTMTRNLQVPRNQPR